MGDRDFHVGEATVHRRIPDRSSLIVVDKAKAAGRLRPDFQPDDLVVLLVANAGIVAAAAPDAWQRHIDYLLQAFSADSTQPLPALPAGPAPLRAMRRTQGLLA